MKLLNWSYLGVVTAGICLSACHPKVVTTEIEERTLDPIAVVASDPNKPAYERPMYNPSYTRRNDLLHTALDVRFDWEKQHLLGKATLKLKPVFYPTDSLRLDAKGFDIHKIAVKNGDKELALEYKYEDGENLYIDLDRTYTAKEEYSIYIEYTAKPNELNFEGSAAITDAKGLYFINPLGDEPDKPQQIWTQGETESSSCWFPTIDRPNERCTQEIYMTVQDKYKTLSNGVLESSTKNADGTRTDYWKMDKPHAPYLFMMTVGEFAVVKDEWEGMLLEYYVEPKYEKDANAIFNYTPEMLTFFSERLGVRYPWPKYSQVVVRDYVSGAMENTTAVIFGDFVQMTERELLDNSDQNEAIVAHEMMHHWFGDLVTCESWANLPLNESFANYSEYLWFEHKYGKDAADYIRTNEMAGYLNEANIRGVKHPLIYYGYADKEDMFDAHSYNKGGTILHMLRSYIGDDAFFEALRLYLSNNQYTAAEVHELRLAFEEVTGEDLNWFFNQWFFSKGHPKLHISKEYNAETDKVTVVVEQIQDYEESAAFILPIDIEIHTAEGQSTRERVWMKTLKETFIFDAKDEPKWVSVDADRVLLCERKYGLSKDEYVFMYYNGGDFFDRSEALRELQYEQKGNPDVLKMFEDAMDDPFWNIRRNAVDAIKIEALENTDAVLAKIKDLALNDPRSDVRAAAMEKLGGLEDTKHLETIKTGIEKDQSYMVISAALNALYRLEPETALEEAKALESEDNVAVILLLAEIYSQTGSKDYNDFFINSYTKTNGYSRFSYFLFHADYLKMIDDNAFVKTHMEHLLTIAVDMKVSQWGRYGAASALRDLQKEYFDNAEKQELGDWANEAIKEIKDKETDPTLKQLYDRWK